MQWPITNGGMVWWMKNYTWYNTSAIQANAVTILAKTKGQWFQLPRSTSLVQINYSWSVCSAFRESGCSVVCKSGMWEAEDNRS